MSLGDERLTNADDYFGQGSGRGCAFAGFLSDGGRIRRCTAHFYCNVFTVVPKGKRKQVTAMFEAIHVQENRQAAENLLSFGVRFLLSRTRRFRMAGFWIISNLVIAVWLNR